MTAPRVGFVYWVRASFQDATVAQEWLEWMRREHIAQVIAAGALEATLLRIEGAGAPGGAMETRYGFADRDAFLRYEREKAPALRAAGAVHFPASRGVAYERGTALILGEF